MSDASLDVSEKPAGLDDLLTPAEVQKLKESNGEFTAIRTLGGVAAFRAPTRGEYARYNQLFFDEKTRAKAFEALVNTCVIMPDRKTFEGWLDKYPGIVTTCVDAVMKLAGVDTDAQTKKYTPA